MFRGEGKPHPQGSDNECSLVEIEVKIGASIVYCTFTKFTDSLVFWVHLIPEKKLPWRLRNKKHQEPRKNNLDTQPSVHTTHRQYTHKAHTTYTQHNTQYPIPTQRYVLTEKDYV